jgi:hypothetical protein
MRDNPGAMSKIGPDDSNRKLMQDLAAARAEIKRLEARSAPPKPRAGREVDTALARIEGLRDQLARTAAELSELHAEEVALSKKRARVLAEASALLARIVGESGQAPPPLPGRRLSLNVSPVVEISELAELVESLRPPRAPKV